MKLDKKYTAITFFTHHLNYSKNMLYYYFVLLRNVGYDKLHYFYTLHLDSLTAVGFIVSNNAIQFFPKYIINFGSKKVNTVY